MNILFLGLGTKDKDISYETRQFVKELRKRNHTVDFALWSSISFSFTNKNGVEIKARGKDLKYFDYIIPRYPLSALNRPKGKQLRHKVYVSRLYRHYLLIIDYINQQKKHILNEKVKDTMLFYDKLFQHYHLAQHDVPILSTLLYTGNQLPKSIYDKFKKPYILKSIEGSRGMQVHKINYKKDIPPLINKYGQSRLLVQKYIPQMRDYRIIVIGNKIIGGIERIATNNDFRANVALGAITKEIKITPEIDRISKKAAKVFNAEFAGVDVIEYKGKHYVLEVNIFPMFEGFEEATKTSVPRELAKYIEKKYLWSIDEIKKEDKKNMLESLYKIEQENQYDPMSKKDLESEIMRRRLVIVRKEGTPIAYATHYKKENERIISRLSVKKHHIGQRIGRRMIQKIMSIVKEEEKKKEIKGIKSSIYIENKLRQESFELAGFKETKRTPKKITYSYPVKS